MLFSRLGKIGDLAMALLKTFPVIIPLLCPALVPAAAQTPATIDIDTTATIPVTPGFSGANSEIGFPIEDWDYRFNALAAQVGYGWLRFPGGNDGDAYDWQTGEEVAAWVAQFSGDSLGTQLQAAAQHVAGKGGARLIDAAARANLLGASLIICANGFTDTPASIGQLAAYVKANQIPVVAWELTNEAYLYPDFFTTGTDYLDKMKPYRDAIKAVDPNAVVAIFISDPKSVGVQTAWNQAITAYPTKYWDALTFHHYPLPKTQPFAQSMADESATLFNDTATLVTNRLTPIGPPGTKFIVTEFDPTLPVDKSTGIVSLTDGTLWGGIYVAEFIMRMSTVPTMLYVGPHAVNNVSGVNSTNNHYGDVTTAFRQGITIDTTTLDFGFYLTAQANGLAVLNGVINHASQSNKTTVSGGANVPATGIAQGIPALYAMSYTNPTAGLSVVITNKSATAHSVTIRVNGLTLTGTFPIQFITGTDPTTVNLLGTPNAVAVQTGNSGNPIVVGPYSVVRVDLVGAPFPDAGQSLSAAGTSGSINLTFPTGLSWTASSSANWLTITGSPNGMGSGTLNYQVTPNAGGDRTATITVMGFTFTVEQEGGAVPGLIFIGSIPHLAAEENWITMITLVDKDTAPATARISFLGDDNSYASDANGSGPLSLPLAFPKQTGASGSLLAASFDQTLPANSLLVASTAGPQIPPVQVGSAQVSATGAVDGFAIFHQIVTEQEAVVPLETRNANSYLLPFDNTNGLVLGVALANLSTQAANVHVVIRDDTGAQIATGSLPQLAAGDHFQFGLAVQFPITANKRGTIEFDTPAGGRISVLGLRFTPPNNALTTIPALTNVGISGGSIAHLASGGDGWQTTFVLVNTGTSSAQATLSFSADQTGAPMSLPLMFPQGNIAATTSSSVTQPLLAGATLLIVSSGAANLLTGSAQLSTNGNVSGFVIFRHNDQEAVVPLESRNASAYIIAFDNANGTFTGVALNAVSAQQVNIPVTVRDAAGATIATDTITLNANGHYAFTLVTDRYPATANIRGTIEFDKPAGAQIGALGIRIPTGAAHTYTTLPALAK